MILVFLIALLLTGGLLAWLVGFRYPGAAKWIALAATVADLIAGCLLWREHSAGYVLDGQRLEELMWSWIPRFGINFHLVLDGLSLILVLLTLFLGVLAVAVSWREIDNRQGFYYFNLLWTLAGILGVFLAWDLFLFYFFWELMLIPMYFLIVLWGHENRVYAGIKFFLFTQAGGLLMLVSILGLSLAHYRETGIWTYDYPELLATELPAAASMWLMLGFFVAFAVKLPAIPFHTWLPDAHTEAPTAGSVILAGLLLKTGAYGLIRFAVPLFPEASERFAPVGMALGAVGILYGAVLAFAQTDLKRLVAYTSVSHLGFVLLGVYAWNLQALQGAVMQIVCHGLSTGGLFILVGIIQERTHTRDIHRLSGLWTIAPRMGAAAMILAMASLGLPGLGNFVAEFLLLLGAFQKDILWTVVATTGLVAATIYSLRLVQDTFQNGNAEGWAFEDLDARELAVLAVLILMLIGLGLYPQPVLDVAGPVLEGLRPDFMTASLMK